VPRGSLREETFIPGRKFVPERKWGGNAVDEKIRTFLFFYSTHEKRTTRLD